MLLWLCLCFSVWQGEVPMESPMWCMACFVSIVLFAFSCALSTASCILFFFRLDTVVHSKRSDLMMIVPMASTSSKSMFTMASSPPRISRSFHLMDNLLTSLWKGLWWCVLRAPMQTFEGMPLVRLMLPICIRCLSVCLSHVWSFWSQKCAALEFAFCPFGFEGDDAHVAKHVFSCSAAHHLYFFAGVCLWDHPVKDSVSSCLLCVSFFL